MAYGSRAKATWNSLRRPKAVRRPALKRGGASGRSGPPAKRARYQTYRNSRAIRQLKRFNARHRVYTDYQLCAGLSFPAPNPTGGIEGWATTELFNIPVWNPVLRMDNDALESTRTYVKHAIINMRYNLGDASDCSFSFFIVTPRRNAPDVDVTTLLTGRDYIENTVLDGLNIRLNPAIFKVHFARQITLVASGMGQKPNATQNYGNPYSTWRKGQVKLPLKATVMQPTIIGPANSWKLKTWNQLPYYQKYSIICYCSAQVPSTGSPAVPEVVFDSLFTCINTD